MIKLLHLVFSLLSFVGYTLSSASCTNSSFCNQVFGNESYCSCEDHITSSTGVCRCNGLYYLANTSCVSCPGYGEECEVSGCCNSPNLLCMDNKVCSCFWADYCWIIDDNDRARLQIAAQIILAISLFLTATILFMLFWNSCIRHSSLPSQNSQVYQNQRNQLSLNSIQRLVLMQLQDRPPPYSPDLMSPSKHLNNSMDAPPSYTDAVRLPPLGESNLAFVFGEHSPSTQDNLEMPLETSRNIQTLPTSSISNNENQNGQVSEANSHFVDGCLNPLIRVLSTSSVNNNSLQSTDVTNNNVSITPSELHI